MYCINNQLLTFFIDVYRCRAQPLQQLFLECWRKTFPWVSHLKIDDLYGTNSKRVEETLRQLRLKRNCIGQVKFSAGKWNFDATPDRASGQKPYITPLNVYSHNVFICKYFMCVVSTYGEMFET